MRELKQTISKESQGFALMEVLVSLSLVAVASMSIALSLTTALRVAKLTEVHFAASTLASGRMEELAAIDAATLSSANNSLDTDVTYPALNMTFTREVVITQTPETRTITVRVASNAAALPTEVSFTTTFALWE